MDIFKSVILGLAVYTSIHTPIFADEQELMKISGLTNAKNCIVYSCLGWLRLITIDGHYYADLNCLGDDPVFSPDGTKIAFTREGEIYIMNVDGSDQIKLTNDKSYKERPVFSPDGSKIAFSSGTDNSDIYVMDTNGSKQKRLTNNLIYDATPYYSPNGTKIIFRSVREDNFGIFIMNADGSDQNRLTHSKVESCEEHSRPVFSPDGRKIVFESSRYSNASDIYIVNTDGLGLTRLTLNDDYDGNPAFSPDGRKIAFDSERNGKRGIYLMNNDGSNQILLTGGWGAPSFSPMYFNNILYDTYGHTIK